MKVGIIGLPQTGKKTLFQILTGSEVKEKSGGLCLQGKDYVVADGDILNIRFKV